MEKENDLLPLFTDAREHLPLSSSTSWSVCWLCISSLVPVHGAADWKVLLEQKGQEVQGALGAHRVEVVDPSLEVEVEEEVQILAVVEVVVDQTQAEEVGEAEVGHHHLAKVEEVGEEVEVGRHHLAKEEVVGVEAAGDHHHQICSGLC